MVYLAWFAFGLLALRSGVAIFNFITQPYLPARAEVDELMVSILIPVRNEANNIPHLLKSLAALSYANLEVLVYNDDSTDETAAIVSNFKRPFPLRVIEGTTLPAGWLGKSHACHFLALEAMGDYFLFLDADVTVEPDLIPKLVTFMRKEKLALISIFPYQRMDTFGEKMVVPVMHWILVSFLPLLLVRITRKVSLSAANGQLMFFDAATYRTCQWHQQVKSIRVEDIAIARLVKGARLRMATLLSRGEVNCRMYGSYSEAVSGLSRSVCAFFGESHLAMLLFSLFSTLGVVIVFLFLSPIFGFIYLLLVLVLRVMVSFAAEQSAVFNVCSIVVQQFAFLQMVVKSLTSKIRGKTEWKGRNLSA